VAIGNMHRKFGEERMCSSEDMIADSQTRQTHTDRPTHSSLIAVLRSLIGGGVISCLYETGYLEVDVC